MGKRVAIVQSNYIPWKGYFDLINLVDEFILLDDVQYTRRDWRNRNKIKTQRGPEWITVPVDVKGKYHQKIKDTVVSDAGWNRHHWNMILANYRRARCFSTYGEFFEELYLGATQDHLSAINERFLRAICGVLEITTKISWSMDYHVVEGKTERLIELCRQAGASDYTSGPSARGYLNEGAFNAIGIEVSWMDYGGYPEYEQLYPPFDHAVSIVDLLLNAGTDARRYMMSFGK